MSRLFLTPSLHKRGLGGVLSIPPLTPLLLKEGTKNITAYLTPGQ